MLGASPLTSLLRGLWVCGVFLGVVAGCGGHSHVRPTCHKLLVTPFSRPASPQCTVGDLKDMACRALGIEDLQQWALWDYAGQKAGASVSGWGKVVCTQGGA